MDEVNYYEAIDIFLDCEFCMGGPIDCNCIDVDTSLSLDCYIDDALEDTAVMFSAVDKLGREQTTRLCKELNLDTRDSSSWKTIDSMAMWL